MTGRSLTRSVKQHLGQLYRTYWIQPRAAYVVSLPKAGRTWLRFMMASVLSQLTGRPMSLDLTSYRSQRLRIPYILFTHNVVKDQGGQFHYSFDKSAFKNRKVLLLVRDPRDATISNYFHGRRMTERQRGEFQVGTLDEFIRGPRGIVLAIEFLNSWAANLSVPSKVMRLRYEDLRADPPAMLRASLEFLEIPDVDDTIISAAVDAGSLEQMRQFEAQGMLSDARLIPGDQSDPESFKVRRGKVGGYMDYLTPKQVSFFDGEVRARLSPVFAEYIRE